MQRHQQQQQHRHHPPQQQQHTNHLVSQPCRMRHALKLGSSVAGRGLLGCPSGIQHGLSSSPALLAGQQQLPAVASLLRAPGPPGVAATAAARTSSSSTGRGGRTRAPTPPPPPAAAAAAGRKGGGQQQAAGGSSSSSGSGPAQQALMIVESPTKATKIQKFLGSGYKVVASYGHVRDLLSKAGAVDPEAGFHLTWQVSPAGEARLRDIAAAAAGAPAVLLATDPDREGEAISWHITQELQRRGMLRPGTELQRVTFTEVTQRAVSEALSHPRQVSQALVDAYLARRALDYLLGFSVSPLLWSRLGPAAKSAGRVQSVALRLVSEREDAVQLFVPQEYWSIGATFSSAAAGSGGGGDGSSGSSSGVLPARLVQVDGQRLAQFSLTSRQQAAELEARLWQGRQPQAGEAAADVHDDKQAAAAAAAAAAADVWYTVRSVAKRPVKRHPPPPLVTSTLQQEAARRLGFSASRTMQVAQQLYEGANTGEGLITYMRTDGVSLSPEAVEELRATIVSVYGPQALPAGGPRVYKSRAKNAQEAHEAIRPTNSDLLPHQARASLNAEQAALYSLIWRRAVACQMESAELQQVTAELESPCGTLLLRSSGSSLSSPGWLAAWADWSSSSSAAAAAAADEADDSRGDAGGGAAGASGSDAEDEDELALTAAAGGGGSSSSGGAAALSALLAQLAAGQCVQLLSVVPEQHFTKPPPRFTEASMIKTLEELGVGRPSTYAPILRKLLDRAYVIKSGRALIPTPLGRLLSAYLAANFTEYVDVNFTARVEEQLDDVSAGSLAWKDLMSEFWAPLQAAVASAKSASTSKVFDQLEQLLEPSIFPPPLPAAPAAADDDDSSSSSSHAGEPPAAAGAAGAAAASSSDPRRCPVCGGRLVLKPSRATGGFIGCSNYESQGCTFGRPLWPDLEEAASLSDEEGAMAAGLGAVRVLGHQPDSGLPVLLKRGPYGLYVQLGDGSSSSGSSDGSTAPAAAAQEGGDAQQPQDDAKQKKKAKTKPAAPKLPRTALPRGLTWATTTLDDALTLLALPRTVGTHPDDGEPVIASSGRFGPYVQHRSLYAQLKEGLAPQDVGLDEAVALLAAKAGRLRARGRDPYAEKPSKGGAKGRKAAAAAGGSSSSSSGGGKKALSGYQFFMREAKEDAGSAAAAAVAAAAASSSAAAGKAAKLVAFSAAWKGLTAAEQAAYKARAAELFNAQAAAESAADDEAAAAGGAGSESAAPTVPAASASKRRRTAAATASSSTGGSASPPGSRRGFASSAAAAPAPAAAAANGSSRSRSQSRGHSSSTSGSSDAAAAPADSSRTRRRGGSTGSTTTSSGKPIALSADASNGSTTTSSSSSSSSRRAPKPQSGYLAFCSQQRPVLLQQEPGLSPSEVMGRLGAAWQALDAQQKAAWSSGGGADAGAPNIETLVAR